MHLVPLGPAIIDRMKGAAQLRVQSLILLTDAISNPPKDKYSLAIYLDAIDSTYKLRQRHRQKSMLDGLGVIRFFNFEINYKEA